MRNKPYKVGWYITYYATSCIVISLLFGIIGSFVPFVAGYMSGYFWIQIAGWHILMPMYRNDYLKNYVPAPSAPPQSIYGINNFCLRCGARLGAHDKFCTKCGTPTPLFKSTVDHNGDIVNSDGTFVYPDKTNADPVGIASAPEKVENVPDNDR